MLVALAAGCSTTPDTKEQPGVPVDTVVIGDKGSKGTADPKDTPVAPVGQTPISSTPITAGTSASGSLPAVLRDPKNMLYRRSVYFDYDSNAVRDEFRPMVQAHARFLLDNPRLRITIQGNTDERGSREYNIALGQRRADAVRQAMTVLGVTERQMEPVSLGEERPRATGSEEASYAENRRADIVYDGEDKPPVGK
ncbi:MAG: peptidoglycan-associated lipoprotein Pal [Proteobacteria bacterium]|nr:peptidoglycan-associated lipoprotein Pal [Burkholderiales bacterium]